MIHNSHPWKLHLARDADLIERWAAKEPPSERRSFLIERKVFLAAYAMRKLDDATKLSTAVLGTSMAVSRFPPVRTGFSEINSHRFADYFDLDSPDRENLSRRRLLDLLIHSLVFVEVMDEANAYHSFMVTSDHDTAKGLVEVEVAAFVALMRLAAKDYPTAISRRLNSKGELRTWAGHVDPRGTKRSPRDGG